MEGSKDNVLSVRILSISYRERSVRTGYSGNNTVQTAADVKDGMRDWRCENKKGNIAEVNVVVCTRSVSKV